MSDAGKRLIKAAKEMRRRLVPEIRKTTLGEIAGMGLILPDGTPVPVVDALKVCWVVYPASVDDCASVYLNEADALFELGRQKDIDHGRE